MGRGKTVDMSQDPDENRVVRLRFLAQKLGTDTDSLRSRMVRDEETGIMLLELNAEEARILKTRYGELPKVGGVKLVEGEEEPGEKGKEDAEEAGPRIETIGGIPTIEIRRIDLSHENPVNLINDLDDPQMSQEARTALINMGINVVYLLIQELENPKRADKAKEILIEIGSWAVGKLVRELGNIERRDYAKEILLKISEKDARTVVRFCIRAKESEQSEYTKDVLLGIAKRDASVVVRNCIWALGNSDRIDVEDILFKIGLNETRLVASYMIIALKDSRIRETCKSFLIKLANIKPEVYDVLDRWIDYDGFNRKALIGEIKASAMANLGAPKADIRRIGGVIPIRPATASGLKR